MSIHLAITNQTRAVIDTRWLARQLRRLLKLLRITDGAWSITLVDDRAMAALHKRTMNAPSTTDVLTFDLRDSKKQPLELDSVLCRDEAARRAKDLGPPVRDELLLYALHSLLHVHGYNDLTARQSARMHRREDSLLLR